MARMICERCAVYLYIPSVVSTRSNVTDLCGRLSASLVYDLSSSKDAIVFCSLLSAHLKEFNHREMRCSGGYFYTLDDVQVIAIDSSTKITRLPRIHDDYC